MKKTLALIGLFTFFSFPASSNNTGISVNIGQPGFYGQINLGNQGLNPRLIYSNPITAIPSNIGIPQQPIYLHVPPGHAKKWSKHCHQYKACGQPVYFVEEKWYNDAYRTQHHTQNSYSDRHTAKNRNHPQRPNNVRGKQEKTNHHTKNTKRVILKPII